MVAITEKEAAERWCPFSRVSCANNPVEGNHAANRFSQYSEGEEMTRCIGSRCMAWRFIDTTHYRPTELWSKKKNARVNSAFGDDAEWRPIGGDSEPPPAIGFCGLSGKP